MEKEAVVSLPTILILLAPSVISGELLVGLLDLDRFLVGEILEFFSKVIHTIGVVLADGVAKSFFDLVVRSALFDPKNLPGGFCRGRVRLSRLFV